MSLILVAMATDQYWPPHYVLHLQHATVYQNKVYTPPPPPSTSGHKAYSSHYIMACVASCMVVKYSHNYVLLHAFHNPSLQTNTKHICKWRQNGTRCRDGVKVLWCHSHLVWLVFEASIPTCTCFSSENFLWLVHIFIHHQRVDNIRMIVGILFIIVWK